MGSTVIRPLVPVALALATVALIAPAAEGARPTRVIAPPGDSAVSQYVEVVPSNAGGTPPRIGGGAGAPGSPLTARERSRFARLGPDGRLLAAVVAETAPAGGPSPTGAHAGAAGGRLAGSRALSAVGPDPARPALSALPSGHGPSPASLILAAATGSGGGAGAILIPAIILSSLLGALALRARRKPS